MDHRKQRSVREGSGVVLEDPETPSKALRNTAAVDLFGGGDARVLEAAEDRDEPRNPLKPGEKFSDQITIVGEVGKGGFSEVYLVTHREFLGKELVMKISRQESDDGRETTLNEIKILQQVHHPNVIRILAAGDDSKRRQVYAVMEYHGKGTLEDWAKKMSTLESNNDLFLAYLHQFARMLEGLEKAHELGLVHRDLKPSNVLVASDGRLILADFGLSRDRKIPEQGSSNETSGSIGFLAPEEVNALLEPETVDHRADVFSVGAVLKYLLTGRTILPECEDPLSYAKEVLRYYYGKRELEGLLDGTRASPLPEALVRYQKTLVARNPSERMPEKGLSEGLKAVIDEIIVDDEAKKASLPRHRIAA